MDKQRLLGSTCILEVDLRCCKACPLRVKKKLQKITGVNSITINVEKGTIAVSGEVDPPTIINEMSKLGKRSELSSFQKNPTTTTTTTKVSKKPQPVKNNIQISQPNNSKKGGTNQDCGCHGDDSDLDSDEDHGHDHDHDKVHMHAHHNNKGHHHGHAPHRPNGINAPPPPPPPRPPMYHPYHNNMYSNGYLPPGSLPQYQSMTRPYVGYGSGHHHYFRPAMFGRPPSLQPVLPAYGHGSYQVPMVPPPGPPPMYGYHNQQQREPPVGNSVLHLFSDDNTSTEPCSIM